MNFLLTKFLLKFWKRKFCFPGLKDCITESLTNNKLPDTLKHQLFKKLDPSDKANFRPVSIPSLVSKVFLKNHMILKKSCFTSTWKILSTSYFVDSVKHIRYNMSIPDKSSWWEKELGTECLLLQFWWNFQKPTTAYHIIYWYEN